MRRGIGTPPMSATWKENELWYDPTNNCTMGGSARLRRLREARRVFMNPCPRAVWLSCTSIEACASFSPPATQPSRTHHKRRIPPPSRSIASKRRRLSPEDIRRAPPKLGPNQLRRACVPPGGSSTTSRRLFAPGAQSRSSAHHRLREHRHIYQRPCVVRRPPLAAAVHAMIVSPLDEHHLSARCHRVVTLTNAVAVVEVSVIGSREAVLTE